MKPKTQLPQPVPVSEPDPELFFSTLIQTAVSQICQSVGYNSTRPSALTALTQITSLYLQTLSKAAVSSSNASGRTQSNLFDVVNALHDVVLPVQCFLPVPGAASNRNNRCLLLEGLSMGLVKDLVRFVRISKEIPFAKPVPRRSDFSFVKVCPETTSLKAKSCRPSHVPNWLPGFPDTSPADSDSDSSIRGRVVLWEDSDSVRASCCLAQQGGLGKVRGVIRIDGGDLAVERRRIRFKIGAS